jgi:hypothetical protein
MHAYEHARVCAHTHKQQSTQLPKITCLSQLQAKNTAITTNVLQK